MLNNVRSHDSGESVIETKFAHDGNRKGKKEDKGAKDH